MCGQRWIYPLIVAMGLCGGTVVRAEEDIAALREEVSQLKLRLDEALAKLEAAKGEEKISSPFAYQNNNEDTKSPAAVNAMYTRYDTGQSSESYVPPQPAPRTRGPVVYVQPTKNYYYTSYTPAYYRGYYGAPYWWGGHYRPSYYYRGCYPYSSVSFGYYHGRSHLRYSSGVSFGCP